MQKTFLYNAHGSALGGFITRPFNEVIESVASISLPVSGGYGSAEVKNYDYHQLIKFNRAYSQVSGSQNPADGSYNTLVSVTIEGLTVADMITARRIVARITTKHSADNTETRVVPTGSEFVDLRIAGEPVEGLTCDPMLTELDTYEKARGRFKNESGGVIRCPLFKDMKHSRMTKQDDQQVIVIPDFGTVYLGECYLKTSERKLTMMRLQLGSPVAGAVALGDGSGNGSTFPTTA